MSGDRSIVRGDPVGDRSRQGATVGERGAGHARPCGVRRSERLQCPFPDPDAAVERAERARPAT